MKETVLITGGTGLLGHALVKALLHKNYNVIILTRTLKGKENTENVRYATWDVDKKIIDVAALQSADHIIHLAGAGVVNKKWTVAYKKQIVESRTQSADLLIETLKKNTHKVKTLVSASAIGWYGEDRMAGKAFTEDNKPETSFLGETCRLWEESVTAAEGLGIRVCKIRIGILLSKDGGALAEFVKPVKFGVAAILGSGKQMVSWIHIDDVCRIFIQAIEDVKMTGSYNAVAPAPVTNEALTLGIAQAMKGKFYVPMHVPGFILKIMMGERSTEILKSTTASSTKIKNTGFTFLYPTLDAALNALLKN